VKKTSINAAIKKLQGVVLVLERALATVEGRPDKASTKRGRSTKAAPKAKAKAKAPRRVTKDAGMGRGRPSTTGRFETRRDLETFVWTRKAPQSQIAAEAGVSTATVNKIMMAKPRRKFDRNVEDAPPAPADAWREMIEIPGPTPLAEAAQ
jgi:hypothetical protein